MLCNAKQQQRHSFTKAFFRMTAFIGAVLYAWAFVCRLGACTAWSSHLLSWYWHDLIRAIINHMRRQNDMIGTVNSLATHVINFLCQLCIHTRARIVLFVFWQQGRSLFWNRSWRHKVYKIWNKAHLAVCLLEIRTDWEHVVITFFISATHKNGRFLLCRFTKKLSLIHHRLFIFDISYYEGFYLKVWSVNRKQTS